MFIDKHISVMQEGHRTTALFLKLRLYELRDRCRTETQVRSSGKSYTAHSLSCQTIAVLSPRQREADLSSVRNEIISLTFISWFTVSPVNTEDVTATRQKDTLVHSEWGNASRSEVPKLFFHKAFAQHPGPQWGESWKCRKHNSP